MPDKIHETNAILTQKMRKVLRTEEPLRQYARELLSIYIDHFESYTPEIFVENRGKSVGCLKRMLTWCGNDFALASAIIAHAFREWSYLKTKAGIDDPAPKTTFFGSSRWFTWVRDEYEAYNRAIDKNEAAKALLGCDAG